MVRPMNGALRCGRAIAPETFTNVVRAMGLEHQKWDAQVGDVAALAPFPLILTRSTWHALASLATELARETVAIEVELARRPELHKHLGLPEAVASALRPNASAAATPAAARIMRFDFHPTTDGWRVSEVNSDVPGGFTESSRFAELVAEQTDEGLVAGDAGAAWIDAIAATVPHGGTVALLSAPGWVEDTQVVAHLAARLRARGVAAHLASPHHLRWVDGRAHLESDFCSARLDAVLRFYQAEWIARLPCREAWAPLFAGGLTPVSNPASAVLTESKRMPLVWSDLDACSVTWQSVLNETRDPRDARGIWNGDWVLKPAFGNGGDDVTLREQTSRSVWYRRVVAALARPRRWIAQRRFRTIAVESPLGSMHPCIGVYVVDGRATGAYARLSSSPVIDFAAIDTAVLLER
jgi:glutathionylspermidine synthase